MLGTYHYHLRAAILTISFLLSTCALANPALNNVAAGQAKVTQKANSTVINQTSQKAILNWNNFNIRANEKVHFQQPRGGVALNRISGSQGASQIYGRLTATGQIILVNPAGIYFGPSAYVNVGGLIATTANIRDRDFLNGQYQFSQPSPYSGAIVNEGQIIVRDNGLAALVASGVVNKGLIEANLGRVVLASGEAFTINFSGDQLINFAITQGTTKKAIDKDNQTLNVGVNNQGTIIANGGQVLITAAAAKGVLDQAINMGGVIQANSVASVDGDIVLSGGDDSVVQVNGELLAKGDAAGEKGGSVTVTGQQISLTQNAAVDVSGEAGAGNINIGGSYQGKGPLPNADQVTLEKGSTLKADAITSGNGGNIIVWSDLGTKAYGLISAQGGALSGNGGFIETSGKAYLDVNGIQVNTLAPKGTLGTWLLDPTSIYIADNQTDATNAGMTTTDTSVNSSGPGTFSATGTAVDSLLLVSTLQAALNTTNVIVTTVNAAATGNGDINVVDPITWASANSLTLNAERNININAAITNTGAGSFTADATLGATPGDISITAPITVPTVTLHGNTAVESGAGAIIANSLTTSTVDATTLQGANQLSNYTGTISGTSATGALLLNNASTAPITLNGVSVIFSPSTGFQLTTLGNVIINGNITLLTVPAKTHINAGGSISQTAGQISNNFNAVSVGGMVLATGNAISDFSAINTGGGDIVLTGDLPFIVGGLRVSLNAVQNSGGGNINIGYIGAGTLFIQGAIVGGGGNITLSSSGAITRNTGSVSSGNLTTNSVTGTSLTGNANNVSSYAASNTTSGNITLINQSAALALHSITQSASGGNIDIENAGNITTDSLVGNATTGTVSLLAGGSFTLDPGTLITSGASGNAIILKDGQASGDTFTNNVGAGALVNSAGNFQIWSYSPTSDFFSSLPANFVQYTAPFGAPVLGAGNGIFFALSPTLVETLVGVTKVYDATTSVNLTAGNYSLSGVVNGDSVAPSSLPTTGTFASANVGSQTVTSSPLALTTPINGQTTAGNAAGILGGLDIYGYAINSVASGTGTITPATLTVTAHAQTKVYGQQDPSFTYSTSGLAGSDTLAGALNRTISQATENVGSYNINLGTLTGGANYTMVYHGAQLTITPKHITVSATPTSKVFAQADVPFVAGVTPGLVNGLVDGVTIHDVLTGAIVRAPGSSPGTYAFNFSNLNVLSNPNYQVTTTPLNFTIQSTQSQTQGTDIPAANQPGVTPINDPGPSNGGNSLTNAINNYYQEVDQGYWGSMKVGDCNQPTSTVR